MKRTDIINKLIEKNKFNTYLEIGLDNPKGNFIFINCQDKESCDPFFVEDHNKYDVTFSNDLPEYIKNSLTYRMTSDELFEKLDKKYDIIFIDGLHTEEQCGKDIINSLKHLNRGGYILVHDCLPPDENHQKVPRIQGAWNGDVWKCIPELEKQLIEYETIDTDYGCCLIKYNENYENLNYLDKSNYCWKDFVENRNKLMHVITVKEFIEKYID